MGHPIPHIACCDILSTNVCLCEFTIFKKILCSDPEEQVKSPSYLPQPTRNNKWTNVRTIIVRKIKLFLLDEFIRVK